MIMITNNLNNKLINNILKNNNNGANACDNVDV